MYVGSYYINQVKRSHIGSATHPERQGDEVSWIQRPVAISASAGCCIFKNIS